MTASQQILILIAVLLPAAGLTAAEPASESSSQPNVQPDTQPGTQPDTQPATEPDFSASQPDFEPTTHLPAATQTCPANSQPATQSAGGPNGETRSATQSHPATFEWVVSTRPASRPAAAQMPQKITLQQAAVLGVVEGLTEYLPVSSAGHLILAGYMMGHSKFSDQPGPLGRKIISSDAISAFDIVIQLGAILAVLGLYRRRVGQMCMGVIGRDPWGLRLLGLLLLAFLPSAVAGLLLHKPIKEYLFGPTTVCWALFIGGLLMIAVERFYRSRRAEARRKNLNQMTAWQALFIGLAQCLALWPGTSRSMITILAAMVVGMEILAAAEFSFLLALPTLGAATLYDGISEWNDLMNSAGPAGLAVGLIVSAVVAAASVRFLVRWLTRHGLTPFGVYRIALAGAIWWLLIA